MKNRVVAIIDLAKSLFLDADPLPDPRRIRIDFVDPSNCWQVWNRWSGHITEQQAPQAKDDYRSRADTENQRAHQATDDRHSPTETTPVTAKSFKLHGLRSPQNSEQQPLPVHRSRFFQRPGKSQSPMTEKSSSSELAFWLYRATRDRPEVAQWVKEHEITLVWIPRGHALYESHRFNLGLSEMGSQLLRFPWPPHWPRSTETFDEDLGGGAETRTEKAFLQRRASTLIDRALRMIPDVQLFLGYIQFFPDAQTYATNKIPVEEWDEYNGTQHKKLHLPDQIRHRATIWLAYHPYLDEDGEARWRCSGFHLSEPETSGPTEIELANALKRSKAIRPKKMQVPHGARDRAEGFADDFVALNEDLHSLAQYRLAFCLLDEMELDEDQLYSPSNIDYSHPQGETTIAMVCKAILENLTDDDTAVLMALSQQHEDDLVFDQVDILLRDGADPHGYEIETTILQFILSLMERPSVRLRTVRSIARFVLHNDLAIEALYYIYRMLTDWNGDAEDFEALQIPRNDYEIRYPDLRELSVPKVKQSGDNPAKRARQRTQLMSASYRAAMNIEIERDSESEREEEARQKRKNVVYIV